MNDTPILSICIPTYNRANVLKQNLDIIIPQYIRHRESIELIISSNSSTDNTDEIVSDIKSRFNVDFEYIVQPHHFENGNIHFQVVVDKAKGKYVHLMGDDDILSPNFYDVALDILKDDYGLIFFNRLAGNALCTCNKVYDPDFVDIKEVSKTSDFAKKMLSVCGFMSAIIFRRDCWYKGGEYNKDNYYGYQWLARIYAGAILLNTLSMYYYMPMLIMRSPRRSWNRFWMLYWFVGLSNLFRDQDIINPGVLSNWLNKLHDKKQNYYIGGLFIAITESQSFYKSKKEEFWPFLNTPQRIAFSLFSNLKPAKFFNYGYRGLLKLKAIL